MRTLARSPRQYPGKLPFAAALVSAIFIGPSTRADAVLKTMKDKLNVINVMHTVGMGGSKLLDAQNLEKNRIVEVWAVLP